ncbi:MULTISPECIES: L,D-transpeptidase [unclassified Yoonia]|uniref:L,D-transpeptidase n=1 Tax=unclassified Yoonia TaxID=2629118 RepID=UPI002AFE39DB|nr:MULTISPECIES: L,D-transpeptidase [unclassified Yoonia]
MLNRRHFIVSGAALFSTPIAAQTLEDAATDTLTGGEITTDLPEVAEVVAPRAPVSPPSMWPVWDRRVTPANYDPMTSNPWGFHPRFLPTLVQANDGLRAGDIHVDAVARYLYHVRGDGTAMRYGVAIARGNLYEPGTYTIRRKAKWPTWRPTDAMIAREPEVYAQHADGMDGGPSNPLGSRAFYLFTGNRDTYLRIHGTPSPRSIGGRASSGCVRMVMAHIIGLYEDVNTGSSAILYPTEVTARS